MAVVGAYEWQRARGDAGWGLVALATNPRPGYANELRVSYLDTDYTDRSAILATIVEGDVISVVVDGVAFVRSVVGTPTNTNPEVFAFPIVVREAFSPADEPANETPVLFLVNVSAPTDAWPTTAELAQVLDVENVTDWQTTLDRVMAAAIDATKGQVGVWDDAADVPDENLSAAALRLAELMSQRPDASVESLTRDASFRAYMTGKTRRFGFA